MTVFSHFSIVHLFVVLHIEASLEIEIFQRFPRLNDIFNEMLLFTHSSSGFENHLF